MILKLVTGVCEVNLGKPLGMMPGKEWVLRIVADGPGDISRIYFFKSRLINMWSNITLHLKITNLQC